MLVVAMALIVDNNRPERVRHRQKLQTRGNTSVVYGNVVF